MKNILIPSRGKSCFVAVLALVSMLIRPSDCGAQAPIRNRRSDTKAAELLNAEPELRNELDSKLFAELKRTLPKAKIGGTEYYFVENDRRVTEEQLLIYATELNLQYQTWHQSLSLPRPIRAQIVAQRQSQLVSEKEGSKVVRWKPGSKIHYCIMKRSFGTNAEAQQRYQSVATEFKAAAAAWTAIDRATVPTFVYRPELDDSPLTATPSGVVFAVWSFTLPESVIASAFFPNDPKSNWNVLIDPQNYFGEGLSFDRTGVLRHELGHVLGFRHEHPRSEAPMVCQTLEVFDNQVIPLGEYDPVSVMHYFCRGFNNPEQEQLNQQRRKLLLTDIDKQGVRLIYPEAGVQSGFEFLDYDPAINAPVSASASVAFTSSSPITPPASLQDSIPATSVPMTASELGDAIASPPLWLEPQDSAAAINQPDLYAWKLFVALNWPAKLEKREADPDRKFGENADTVWESWKLSSGKNDQVFLAEGKPLAPGSTRQQVR